MASFIALVLHLHLHEAVGRRAIALTSIKELWIAVMQKVLMIVSGCVLKRTSLDYDRHRPRDL